MLVVKDSMVLIHLAKMALLEDSCAHFGEVVIPQLVFEETVKAGTEKGFLDAMIIDQLIQSNKINVKTIKEKSFIKKANDWNIFGGEAQAVSLYWQEKANLLACDDDNVRSKKEILNINLIGTPAIVLELFRQKKISTEKAKNAINKLRKVGWFSPNLVDFMQQEVNQ